MSQPVKRALMAMCAVLLLLGLLEGTLRILGFRFIPPSAGAAGVQDTLMERNGDILTTRAVYTQVVQPQRIRLDDPGTDFRIGVVGGSSIHNLGSLDPMRVMLHAHTTRHLPVINFGAVSYGTVRELLHLPELLSYKPNVLIIYSGHNEFEENLLSELRIRAAPFHSLDNWLTSSLRLYQAVSFGIHEAGGMLLRRELLAPIVSPERRMGWDTGLDKEKVFDLYRRNLERMLALASDAGVPTILSTVAYNRLSPPFAAGPGSLYGEGMKLFGEGRYLEAKPLLERGLDEDRSPHRATETSNRIVRELAGKYGSRLLDVDAEMSRIAPHNIPGNELFDDHCHLNHKWGNRVLQRLFAGKILELKLLPQ